MRRGDTITDYREDTVLFNIIIYEKKLITKTDWFWMLILFRFINTFSETLDILIFSLSHQHIKAIVQNFGKHTHLL